MDVQHLGCKYLHSFAAQPICHLDFSDLHTGASKVTLMTVPDPKMEMRSWRADFLCVSLSDIVSNLSGRTLDNRLMTSTGKHAYPIRTGRGAGEGATVRNRASNSVEFADPLL